MSDIRVLVEGGRATAGAPLGPALGPTGVNIGEVVAKINEKTKNFDGTKVPVKVIVDSAKKSFEIEVGSPSTSALIKKELKIKKGAPNPKKDVNGNLSMNQLKKIAEMKLDGLNSYKLLRAAREVVGTANSMGIQINGRHAKEIQKDFEQGKFDSFFGEESTIKEVKREVDSFVGGMANAAIGLGKEKNEIKKEVEKTVKDVAKEVGAAKNTAAPVKEDKPEKTE